MTCPFHGPDTGETTPCCVYAKLGVVPAAGPWISDRLPEEGQRVLAWWPDQELACIATYEAAYQWPFTWWAEIRGPE